MRNVTPNGPPTFPDVAGPRRVARFPAMMPLTFAPTWRQAAVAAVLLAVPAAARGQTATDSAATRTSVFSSQGAHRAELAVNAVYIDRVQRDTIVDGGDFASHLLERLGVRPVPDSMALTVRVDTSAVFIEGRVRDLPPAAAQMLGPAFSFVDPNSLISANVSLIRNTPGVVRFRLKRLRVNGTALPEPLLATMMAEVGYRVPVLTKTGRDLLVAIPPKGDMTLVAGGIRLIGPPADSTRAAQPRPAAPSR